MIKTLNQLFFKNKSKYASVDQLRYLSQSALIEEAVAPYVVRTTLLMVSIIIIVMIFWSAMVDIQEIAATEGEVIPSKRVQSIQHLEGGVIKAIEVREGDIVAENQVLVVLDDYNLEQDLEALYSSKRSLMYNQYRLKCFINRTTPDFKSINNQKIDAETEQAELQAFNSMIEARESEEKVIKEQIDQKKDSLKILEEKQVTLTQNRQLVGQELNMKKQLVDKGHISKSQYLQVQQRYNDSVGQLTETNSAILQARNSIEEYETRLSSLGKRYIDDAHQSLDVVEDNLAQVQSKIDKLESQIEKMKVRSPVHGFVKGIVMSSIGGVIAPGQVIMQIVPIEGDLIIETHIKPRDIGYIKPGFDVNVKVSAYDSSRYGIVKGKLTYISATTFTNDLGEKYYLGRVSLDKNYVGSDPHKNLIIPGMTVQADIVTGSKSILSYLLKPVSDSVDSSFSER